MLRELSELFAGQRAAEPSFPTAIATPRGPRRRARALVLAVVALAGANAVAGCYGGGGGGSGGSGGSGTTCRSAVNSFYDQGCAFFAEDDLISRSEMISECEEAREDAPECGCVGELDRTIDCFQAVRSDEECGSCNSQFEDLILCFEGC